VRGRVSESKGTRKSYRILPSSPPVYNRLPSFENPPVKIEFTIKSDKSFITGVTSTNKLVCFDFLLRIKRARTEWGRKIGD
jgi:hypothetical protein